jgi:hypothetical protein
VNGIRLLTLSTSLSLTAAIGWLLAGCTTVSKVALPDGTAGLSIDCTGYEWAACMNKAAKTCAGKYSIVSRDKGGNDAIIPIGGMWAAMDSRVMIVRCEK